MGAARGEDPVGIFQSNYLVELHKVDAVGAQSLKRFVDLLGGRLFGSAVDLGHEKDLLAITVPECLSHANFAETVVVVPAVVHEGDSGVDRATDDPNAVALLFLSADMMPAQA